MAPQRPHLLVLASTYPAHPGDGVPAFVQDLAEVQAREYDVTVLVPSVPGAPATERSQAGVTVRRFRYFPRKWEDLADGAIIENLRSRPSRWLQVLPFMVSEALAVRREVRQTNPVAVHAHWIIPQGLIATLVAPSVPRVVTSLGGDLYALRAKPLRALKSYVVRHAAALTTVNTDMEREVIALGADPSKVTVIPMGADLRRFTSNGRDDSNDGPLRMLFVGRLVEKKGLAVLLKAVRQLEPGVCTLTVVGDGPLRKSLEDQAAGLPVEFVGQRDRNTLANDYRTHDVIVVPSVPAASGDQDGLPVALLEAMGSGCAVIASDLPGINEAIINGENGILVTPSSASSISSAILNLHENPQRCHQLRDSAVKRSRGYSVEATAKQYTRTILRISHPDSNRNS